MEEIKFEKKDIKESPRDIKTDAVIIQIERKMKKDLYEEVKFGTPEDELLIVHFEYMFDNKPFKDWDKMAYYPEPLSGTNIGKFVDKYGTLTVGAKCKIDVNGQGFAKIVLE